MILVDDVQIEINSVYDLKLREEILDKVSFLLSCVKGTILMNRDVGIDPDVISAPAWQAQNLYTMSAIELIDEFETRAAVEGVYFTSSEGNLIPKVVLIYNGE
jgi:hypothetical protein